MPGRDIRILECGSSVAPLLVPWSRIHGHTDVVAQVGIEGMPEKLEANTGNGKLTRIALASKGTKLDLASENFCIPGISDCPPGLIERAVAVACLREQSNFEE